MTDRNQAPNRELRSLNAEEVESTLAEWGHKSYRVTQILGWLYKKRACSIDEMSDLPQELSHSSWPRSNARGTVR